MLGNHPPKYDANGILLPWTSWTDALDREMKWYAKCPIEHGYPRFVYMTFMNGDYTAVQRSRRLFLRLRTARESSPT
ncbi:MAG: hypothetical protein U0903_19480 [Planctomycetales bacterium]